MNTVIIRTLGLQNYLLIWEKMKCFTHLRDQKSPDELWLVEHFSVFTQGLAGKPEHILNPHQIPIIQTDRGGQVTYHGPGQLLAYAMIDLKRKQLTIKDLIFNLEQTIIDLLVKLEIPASRLANAPGVYVHQKKIASLGLRVRKGCSFHGLALNYQMDLLPFSYINPCGYKDLEMTQISDFDSEISLPQIQSSLINIFCNYFGYTNQILMNDLLQTNRDSAYER